MPLSRNDLIEQRKKLLEAVETRRKLGGFDTNAEAILLLLESQLVITQQLLGLIKK